MIIRFKAASSAVFFFILTYQNTFVFSILDIKITNIKLGEIIK